MDIIRHTSFSEAQDIVIAGVGPEQWLEHFSIPTWPQITQENPVELVVSVGRGIHGGEMTPAQEANVRLACDIFEVQKAISPETRPILLFSGGWSENRGRPGVLSEAGEMLSYAMNRRGVDRGTVITDTGSMDTFSSLFMLAKLVDNKELSRVVVVADYTHAPRVKFLVSKLSLGDKVEVVASLWQDSENEKAENYIKWEVAGYLSSFLPRDFLLKVRGYN